MQVYMHCLQRDFSYSMSELAGRGDIRNTSLISFVNLCLRVGSHSIDRSGLLDCAVTADTEREEKHTPLAHKKSHSIPEWRQTLWTVSVIHIYSITAQFKLQ